MRVYNFVMRVAFCGRENFVAGIKSKVDLIEILVFLAQKERQVVCYCGKDGELNGFAADCVNKVKNKYKNITCVLVIPYGNGRQAKKFSESGLYDETICLGAKDLPRLTANACEEWMIEQSDLVIALGGAAKACAYAEKRKKIVLRL